MEDSVGKEFEASGARLRWQTFDEETGDTPKTPQPQLTSTASNVSGRSLSRRGSIDPAHTLPIHYRRMSVKIMIFFLGQFS